MRCGVCIFRRRDVSGLAKGERERELKGGGEGEGQNERKALSRGHTNGGSARADSSRDEMKFERAQHIKEGGRNRRASHNEEERQGREGPKEVWGGCQRSQGRVRDWCSDKKEGGETRRAARHRGSALGESEPSATSARQTQTSMEGLRVRGSWGSSCVVFLL